MEAKTREGSKSIFMRLEGAFSKAMEAVSVYGCGFGLVAMMLYVTTNVFCRYVLHFVVVGMTEFVAATLAPVTFLAFAHGWTRRGSFVKVAILENKLGEKGKWLSQLILFSITLIVYAIIIYGSIRGFMSSYSRSEFVGGIGYFLPAWPWRASIAVGIILFEIRVILDIIMLLKTRRPLAR